MGLLKWVVGILAVFASTLVSKDKAVELSIAVFVGLVVFHIGNKLLGGKSGPGISSNSPPNSSSSGLKLDPPQMNESLYELHTPVGDPSMQIIFFHGLPFGDLSGGHLSTWESGDGSCYWPKMWLGEDFPDAQILVVSYIECLRKGLAGSFGMYNIGENLTSDLIDARVGQIPYCPVVLVGHSFGGLVIKTVCMQAQKMLISKVDGDKVKKFLDSIKGVFYYSTPHHGSPHISIAANILHSPLLKYFTVLSTEAEQLNHEFQRLCRSYPSWQIKGLGESQPVKSGTFRGVVVAQEATTREGDTFNVDETADHFSISKPEKKTSRRFTALKELLHNIANNLKEEIKIRDIRALEDSRPQNWQRLPEQLKGLDFQLQQVKANLESCKRLGFVGMGGLGKTTLAKAIFNEFGSKFEYTCFVSDVKLIPGNEKELKKEVWTDMHCHGKKTGEKEEWFKLREKKLLLVLDDISTDRDVEFLLDIARDSSAESRFIVTSRDKELLKSLDDVYQVRFLDEDNARQLFMSHAFPGQATPPLGLKTLVWRIVEKCEGLPLTLEVLGKYLNGKDKDRDWEQTLDALTKAEAVQHLNKRLWEKLRPSYDGLGEKEQQIFLDSATFFNRGDNEIFSTEAWTLREAKAAWSEAYDTESVNLLWLTLVDGSLVYNVADSEYIKMHEQLRSLGRKIASESNNNSRCRVWETREAVRLLQATDQIDDNKEVHVFKCCGYPAGDPPIGSPALCRLKKVQFLELDDNVVIDGPVEVVSFPRRLVLLKCVGLKIFNPALQSRLAVLKLRLGEEFLPSSIGELRALRVLVLSQARRQEHIPDEVGNLSKLQHLRFSDCGALHTLPHSFGNLSALEHLEFLFCRKLKALPESFGNLSALKHLKFYDCEELEALPQSFGNLSAIKHLEFFCCKELRLLPKSFGDLSTLEHLEFERCLTWQALPESLAELRALRHLIVDCIPVESIPDYIKSMQSLHTLELGRLPFVMELPPWLGDIGTTPVALSRKTFRIYDGHFNLIKEITYTWHNDVIELVHKIAMKKVRVSDYEGALADLCRIDLGRECWEDVDDRWQGFLLQERGIAKRFIGDLQGALEDLTAASGFFLQRKLYAYDCWKHKGFVNFLLRDLDGAQNDAEMALKFLAEYTCNSVMSPSLGEESVTYMHFELKNTSEMTAAGKPMRSSLLQTIKKMVVEDLLPDMPVADNLAIASLPLDRQEFFLQEMRRLKRVLRDQIGDLQDKIPDLLRMEGE